MYSLRKPIWNHLIVKKLVFMIPLYTLIFELAIQKKKAWGEYF